MHDEDLFEEKERAEEARYKMSQELRFKAHSRRNKLLGQWAAKEMGLSEEKAKAYVGEVILADFEEPGRADLVRKIVHDFELRDLVIDEETVGVIMDRLMDTAMEQVAKEYPTALGPDHERVGD